MTANIDCGICGADISRAEDQYHGPQKTYKICYYCWCDAYKMEKTKGLFWR